MNESYQYERSAPDRAGDRLELPRETGQPGAIKDIRNLAMKGDARALDLLVRVIASNTIDGWAYAPMTRKAVADALVECAICRGGIDVLRVAVRGYRALIKDDWPRARSAGYWAESQNDLSCALKTLADRTGETYLYDEAITAYRLALEVYTRDFWPKDWAMVQNNIGNALDSLAAQLDDTLRLEDAIASYRLALEVWTREAAPTDWAMVQRNLGVAQSRLGSIIGQVGFLAHLIHGIAEIRLAGVS